MKKKVIIISILVMLAGFIIYWKLPYSPEKKRFYRAMQERADAMTSGQEVCTREEIEKLPEPVRKYCEYIGLENFPKYKGAQAVFADTDFVFDTKSGKILNMDYDLWIFNGEIYRSAFCSSSMFGIPFDGVDYVTEDGQGGMKGILAKAIQIFDVRDEQGYKAGIISWLAESATINPAALLSPYVTYEELDDTHVKATVSYHGVSGSGVFTFDEEGRITEFYSDERQVEEIDGEKLALGWKCIYEEYEERNGLKLATKISSIKVFPDGKELVYFAADDYRVKYIE